MVKKIRKRFILFNMIVITCVFIFLATVIYFGSTTNQSISHFVSIMIIILLLSFVTSYVISKYALQPIKQAWQKQLDFTADASHELRTPLAVIKTNLEIVMDNPDETVESQMKWLQNIEAEHTRMAKLVEDLLTLSRADIGEQSLFLSTFMIDEVIRQVTDTFRPLCQQKGITLKQDIEMGISFHGDEKRISQLIVILLDNAVQYTPHGNITVRLRQKEGKLELTVQDTGRGIPKEDTQKIFERFYRANHTRSLNPDGSGLGLSIAKWIVAEHNGTISAKSELGKWTKITVNL